MDDQRNQVLDTEGDQHLLQQSVGGVSMGNTVNLPVMITMQGNNGRSDVLNPIIPQPFYPVIQQYPYTNNNTIPYNTDMASGTGSISLSSVTPNINISQVISLIT